MDDNDVKVDYKVVVYKKLRKMTDDNWGSVKKSTKGDGSLEGSGKDRTKQEKKRLSKTREIVKAKAIELQKAKDRAQNEYIREEIVGERFILGELGDEGESIKDESTMRYQDFAELFGDDDIRKDANSRDISYK